MVTFIDTLSRCGPSQWLQWMFDFLFSQYIFINNVILALFFFYTIFFLIFIGDFQNHN
jgi:hypothetical protein